MGKFRTASIILTENCHLGKISQEIYNEFVLAEKQKSLTTELDFLTNNFFFDNIPIATFRSRYFYNFVKIEFSRGKILFKEKEFCEKLKSKQGQCVSGSTILAKSISFRWT